MEQLRSFVITIDPKGPTETVSRLNKEGFDVEIFEGVKGKDLNDSYIKSIVSPLVYYNLRDNIKYDLSSISNKSELGCSLSHALLWQKCIDLDNPIIIFEDDFISKNDFSYNKLMEYYDEAKKYDVGVLRFGIIVYDNNKNYDYKIISDNLYHGFSLGNQGYIITPYAAKILLEKFIPLEITADRYINLIMYQNKDLVVLNTSINFFNFLRHPLRTSGVLDLYIPIFELPMLYFILLIVGIILFLVSLLNIPRRFVRINL